MLLSRRTFLKTTAVAALGIGMVLRAKAEAPSPQKKEFNMEIKRNGSQPSSILLRRGYGGTRRAGLEEVTSLRQGYGLASA
jgi:hypothetical protein